jgi:hypothetical protein
MILGKNCLLRIAVVGVLVWTALLAFTFGPEKALASGCRTDPILVLNNGAQLQIEANIATSYANVHSVIYKVHAPARTAMLLVIYTDNPLGSIEKVQFYADSPNSNYTIETVVQMRNGSASVTTSSILVNVLGLTVARDSAIGTTGLPMMMTLGRNR